MVVRLLEAQRLQIANRALGIYIEQSVRLAVLLQDLVLADVTEEWRAVLVDRLQPHNLFVQPPLVHLDAVRGLQERGGVLIDVNDRDPDLSRLRVATAIAQHGRHLELVRLPLLTVQAAHRLDHAQIALQFDL